MAILSDPAAAATSIFANSDDSIDSTTHAPRYRGTGGDIEVGVCIVPGTENANAMVRPVMNAVATWNGLRPTSANARRNLISKLDFESVLLHEMGHCQGLGHTDLSSQPGVGGSRTDYVAALRGGNGQFDTAPGPDGIIATADDARGDDVNAFRFFAATNDPYTLPEPVDATTFTRDVAELPAGDLFPVGSDYEVSALPGFRSRWSEAVMNQQTPFGEVQRTLAHDDVAGIRYARSGLDHLEGTADDYAGTLVYRGITSGTDAEPCDITAAMDATETGFAVCRVGGLFLDDEQNISLTRARMFFNPTYDWDFNADPPCSASTTLPQATWVQVSLPCLVGISTGATVRDVLGDDLGAADLGRRWAVFAYTYADAADGSRTASYRDLGLDDTLDSGVGYWLITSDADRTIDVAGEYPSQPDVALDTTLDANGARGAGWNMIGNPFRNASPWDDALVVSDGDRVITLEQADPALPGTAGAAVGETACTAAQPRPTCTVSRFGYRYDPALEDYVRLAPGGGDALGPFEAAWVFSGAERARFRPRMTGTERSDR